MTAKEFFRKNLNVPNVLTMIRLLLVPVYVALFVGGQKYAALATFLVASLTDLLDGRIARKYNLVTNFGKFMDPIADKLLVMSAFVVLVGQGRMPSWACIIVLGREFVISGFRLVAADAGRVIAAGPLGKIKTVTQMAAFFSLVSCVDYIARNRDCLKDR